MEGEGVAVEEQQRLVEVEVRWEEEWVWRLAREAVGVTQLMKVVAEVEG